MQAPEPSSGRRKQESSATQAGPGRRRDELPESPPSDQGFDEPGPPGQDASRATLKLDLPDAGDEALGTRISHYKLLERLGEGGCGVVYVAEQTEPVRRRVALKVIKLGMDTKQVVARFEAERQALALMDHPNIAKVLDGGTTDTGRPYFVMELVRGIRITDYCDQNSLPAQARVDLFIHVCHAIQHAHQKGIIHRDIKPSNILVTLHDGVPVPKVIDFGIAKATEGRLTEATVYTQLQQFIGTPAYMSPEQAEMSGLDIDTRSDIYSLGVLLYELLAGSTPFDAKELMAAGIDAMRKTIREKEPVRPSTRLATLKGEELTATAKRRSSEAPKLIHLLRGDLDWIVMKCLEKDRTRRYETANGLAADLTRHLTHEPVLARPASTLYRLRKSVRRNRLAYSAATAVVGALALGIAFSSWQAVRAKKARRDEVAARLRADQAARFAESQRELAERGEQKAKKAEIAARVAETNALRQAYSACMLGACDALEHAQIDTARYYLDSAPAIVRGWEWRHLSSRLDLTLRVHDHPRSYYSQIHVLPDGRSYYEVGDQPTMGIRRWDIDTGQLLATISTGHIYGRSWLVAGGERLIAQILEGGRPGAVEVWDLERRTRLSSQPVPAWVEAAPDGCRVAYEWQQKIHIMDTRSGATRVSPTAVTSPSASANQFTPGRFQPDGRRLAVCSSSGEVALLDTDSLEILTTFEAHNDVIRTMVFSADSRLLATGYYDNTICITDVAANPPAAVTTLRGRVATANGMALCFSPNGSLLAWCGQDRTLRLWDTRTGSPRGVFESDGVDPSFLPDGQTLIDGDSKEVRFWDVRSSDAWVFRGHRSFVYPVLLSLDGATIYSGGWDGFVGQPGCLRFWDAATGDQIAATGAADAYVRAAALSVDGSRLAIWVISMNGTFRHIDILDTATGTAVASVSDTGALDSLAFDPSGQNVIWIDYRRGVAYIADARTGIIRISRRVFGGISSRKSSRVAWSPDGATIAVYNPYEPTLDLLDGQSLEPVRRWPHGHKEPLNYVAFSPEGRRILTASDDRIVRVWDAASGKRLHDLVGHGNRVFCAVYSPDGKRIASGGNDNNVRIWDAETFEPLARLGGHEDYVFSLAWGADSQQLISGSGDHTVRIWNTQPLKDRMQARRERQAILAQVEPMVQRLFAELGDAGKVVERIKTDALLSTRARQVALQVVLRTSLDPHVTVTPSLETYRLDEVMQAFSKAIELASSQTNAPRGTRTQLLLNRSNLLKRLNRFAEAQADLLQAQADLLQAKEIPARTPDAKPNLIDLTGQYNVSFKETWHQSAGRSDLSEMPRGVQKFGGIEFDVRALIQVGFQAVNGEPYPKEVSGIAVHRRCQRLHFLHSAINAFSVPHGIEIGHYLVHYADGREGKLPLVIGRDLGDWFEQPQEPKAQWEVVWTGTNESSRTQGRKIRLFKTTWENPRPDAVIETIDVVSTEETVAPFVVAITAEPE